MAKKNNNILFFIGIVLNIRINILKLLIGISN
jgi:hypothetical protein